MKCNTDGACKGNPGLSAYGFCIKDGHGNLKFVEARGIGVATNMMAKAEAIKQALKASSTTEFSQLIVESDSLGLVNILKGSWKIPRKLMDIIEEIKELMGGLQIQIRHTFREANQLADFLANKTVNKTQCMQFSSFLELPSMARRILNTDKYQVPTVRIKTRRIRSFQHNG